MVCMQGNKHWLSISNYFLAQENKIFIRWRWGMHGAPGWGLRLCLECFFLRVQVRLADEIINFHY